MSYLYRRYLPAPCCSIQVAVTLRWSREHGGTCPGVRVYVDDWGVLHEEPDPRAEIATFWWSGWPRYDGSTYYIHTPGTSLPPVVSYKLRLPSDGAGNVVAQVREYGSMWMTEVSYMKNQIPGPRWQHSDDPGDPGIIIMIIKHFFNEVRNVIKF